jgi:hypothetical protein
MKRREFITLLGGAAAVAWPGAGQSQPHAKLYLFGTSRAIVTSANLTAGRRVAFSPVLEFSRRR